MDAMDMNECGMLSTIDQTIKFRSLVPMNTKQHAEYYRALDQILRNYNLARFAIRTIHFDGEFRGMMEKVKDNLDVDMNFTNAQDHVPEAERNNWMINERIQGPQTMAFHHIRQFHGSWYNIWRWSKLKNLNVFPVKGGVSNYYSHRMILNQTNLDYTKHCVVPFGAYVQANHESTKTSSNVTRALDAIYLRPAQNVHPANSTPKQSLTNSNPILKARANNGQRIAQEVIAQAAAVIGSSAFRLIN
jgi:hypothetical protein